MEKQEKLSVRQAFVQELKNKILSGELSVGEKLPPARELCHIREGHGSLPAGSACHRRLHLLPRREGGIYSRNFF